MSDKSDSTSTLDEGVEDERFRELSSQLASLISKMKKKRNHDGLSEEKKRRPSRPRIVMIRNVSVAHENAARKESLSGHCGRIVQQTV